MLKKVLFLTIIAIVAASCGPSNFSEAKSSSPKTGIEAIQVEEKNPGKTEWEKVLSLAKKENRVTLYTTNPPLARAALSDGFYNRSGIKIEVVTGTGSEIANKLLAEHRNGLFLADVYSGGTTTALTALKPQGVLIPFEHILFLPEVVDTKLWFKNALPWMDKGKTLIQTKMSPGHVADVVFNTNLATKAEFESWYDLLNPRLKGKMNLQDPTTPGKGLKWVNKALNVYGLNLDYLKALARQEPFVTRDIRLMVEWVARGKHIVSILPENTTADEFMSAGAPIKDTEFKESRDILGGGYSGIASINRPPHPNAAKLFINWYLSREGQTLYARARQEQSAREDVPTDHLLPDNIRKPGVDYAIETEEFILNEPKVRTIALDIFGPLLK